jgi:hypothetical protein
VKPAFASSRQAAAFAALLAVLMSLPVLLAKTGVLRRSDVYPTIPWRAGPFPFIQQKIFAETGDADMVFLGSSHIWNDVNPVFVQKELSAELGRETEVFTLGWPWDGFDAAYVIARDLLDHRRVHTLIIYDENQHRNGPHVQSARWFRIGDESGSLAGLPPVSALALYGSAVLGAPRHLLTFVRRNLLEDPARAGPNYWTTEHLAPNFVESRGAKISRLAYNSSPNFVPFHARAEATPADAVIFSAETAGAFGFGGQAMQPYQLHFARKLAQLCHDRGTQLVFLHLPDLTERGQTVIRESQFWPEVLGAPAEIVGIPPARLFAGLSEADQLKLFWDDKHLNQNGLEMFTSLITPALVKLYVKATIH